MNLILLSIVLFFGAYLLNMFYITVFYHRGLAHGAVELHPHTRNWIVRTGNWITGIDPKAWVCMHRMHHLHSDREKDPHSPWNVGLFGVMLGQLHSYKKVLVGLARQSPEYIEVVTDLDFPVSWLNQKKIWLLPYVLHLFVAVAISGLTHAWFTGAAYWVGMMSHPIQGWMVNSFAHKYGYRNYANDDQSRNNTWVAWLTMGEGYQNNHHAHPSSSKFSERWFEMDAGYALCVIAEKLRLLKLNRYSVGRLS
jgi:stearoyl-CoA desaturase (delta-9 desaturase)